MIDILIEFGLGITRLFINPLFYIAIAMSVYLGYRRVKRERRNFHIRILSGWSELSGLFKEGLLLSLSISLLSLAIGLTVPIQLLFMVTIISVVALVTYFFHLLSPIIYITISIGLLMVMGMQNWSFNLFGLEFMGVNVEEGAAVTISILVGLLLIAEGILIRQNGALYASPIVEKTKRGMKAVAFLSKKVWVLPIFLVIPGDAIQAYFPFWPQFSLGTNEFSIVLFPIVIGFQQMARHSLPINFYQRLGRSVLVLGEIVVIGGLISYFEPLVGLVVLLVGFVWRIFLSIVYRSTESNGMYAVSPKADGVMIAAVLPDSPAEKMGLVAGEVIRKVNGVEVHTVRELYEALQKNAAHCRIEVIDQKNELRLTQHVVHSKDHHQVGLLLVE